MFAYKPLITIVLLSVVPGLSTLADEAPSPAPIPVTAGVRIRSAARLKPGAYRLADQGSGIVQITGSGFEVDCAGARIVGPGKGQGIGIRITDARNVTIRNADVTGCLWGIVLERCVGVRLVHCRSSVNNDLKPGTVIDESGREPEDQWGGGILIRDCRDCTAQRCTAQYQWDGIDIIRSEGCVIEDGDVSYNGNWGVHFWDSSRNAFRRNRAVWCTTGGGKLYQALTGWQTYDAQAVGIDHNSCENVIEGNDLRFGGDAIFIRANEGPITPGTVVPPHNGSHRNVLRDNDCSFSPNNAIEVDLVDDTVIENNNCSNSHYGMWLGYSRRCVVRGNICINDTAHAVEIENGQSDLFEHNVFGWDVGRPNDALVYLRQNGRDATPSRAYKLVGNDFYGAGVGVLLRRTEADLTGNWLETVDGQGALVRQETPSDVREVGTEAHPPYRDADPGPLVKQLRPGVPARVDALATPGEVLPPVVEVAGIPVWVSIRDNVPGVAELRFPADMWDRPAATSAGVRVRSNRRWTSYRNVAPVWPPDRPRIDSITPNPARIGDTVTVRGVNLGGASRLLLNGKPVPILVKDPGGDLPPNEDLSFRLPEGILVPSRYNLIWERGTGENRVHTWPITFSVDVRTSEMPHLISATFDPRTLKVGDLLKVTMTVRNNCRPPPRSR
jgi:parallel beta-helix repeat protein